MSKETTPKIHLALAAIAQGIEAIAKDKKNEAQGFKFRGIDDIYNNLHPLFAKHGVICLPSVEKIDSGIFLNAKQNPYHKTIVTINFTFMQTDGSSVACKMTGEGADHGDKSTSKALSMAHKYALIQCFLIPTSDLTDSDTYSPNVDAAAELRALRAEELRERLAELKKSFDGANATQQEFDAYVKAKTAIESELYAKTQEAEKKQPGTPVEPSKPKTEEKPPEKPAKTPEKTVSAPTTPKAEEKPAQAKETQAAAPFKGKDWRDYRIQRINASSRYHAKQLGELNAKDITTIKEKWVDKNAEAMKDDALYLEDAKWITIAYDALAALANEGK